MSTDSGDVADYYDRWAPEYDRTLAGWRYEAPELAARRLRALLGADSVVLDVGCGTGLSGEALAGAGFKVVDGVDLSHRSLKVASQRGIYRSLEQVDLQHQPLPQGNDAYDGLACVGVLTYLPDSAAIARELARVVRPGGAMVLTQRSDILEERDFPGVLKGLERDGVIEDARVSEPSPYLPDNDEFGNEILVHYITCRVA